MRALDTSVDTRYFKYANRCNPCMRDCPLHYQKLCWHAKRCYMHVWHAVSVFPAFPQSVTDETVIVETRTRGWTYFSIISLIHLRILCGKRHVTVLCTCTFLVHGPWVSFVFVLNQKGFVSHGQVFSRCSYKVKSSRVHSWRAILKHPYKHALAWDGVCAHTCKKWVLQRNSCSFSRCSIFSCRPAKCADLTVEIVVTHKNTHRA